MGHRKQKFPLKQLVVIILTAAVFRYDLFFMLITPKMGYLGFLPPFFSTHYNHSMENWFCEKMRKKESGKKHFFLHLFTTHYIQPK